MLLGVDDTDSLSGGCTTHAAVQLLLRLRREQGLVPIECPWLVRLNPTNPWKTRGNAAVALRLGRAMGEPRVIGQWDGEPLEAFPGGEEVPPDEGVLEAAWEVVLENTWEEDGRTNPGLVLSDGLLPPDRYAAALHTLVDVDDAVEGLSSSDGVMFRGAGTRRGLVGASAAVAWPGGLCTWELLAYRPRGRWGTDRRVDPASVEAMEGAFPSTFDSMDAATGDLTMVPNSPCPVLYGIRGTEAGDLPAAAAMVGGEEARGWVVFRTNQATDDHLLPRRLREVGTHGAVAVGGRVVGAPRTIEGGHVLFELEAEGATMPVAAYEPTKAFRTVVRALRAGDEVVACGSVREEPRTLNAEKLRLVSLGSAEERVKVSNPPCPSCGRAMKSAGEAAGYRCRRCGTRATEAEATWEVSERTVEPGWYEVPSSARRHLARPLRLGLAPRLATL